MKRICLNIKDTKETYDGTSSATLVTATTTTNVTDVDATQELLNLQESKSQSTYSLDGLTTSVSASAISTTTSGGTGASENSLVTLSVTTNTTSETTTNNTSIMHPLRSEQVQSRSSRRPRDRQPGQPADLLSDENFATLVQNSPSRELPFLAFLEQPLISLRMEGVLWRLVRFLRQILTARVFYFHSQSPVRSGATSTHHNQHNTISKHIKEYTKGKGSKGDHIVVAGSLGKSKHAVHIHITDNWASTRLIVSGGTRGTRNSMTMASRESTRGSKNKNESDKHGDVEMLSQAVIEFIETTVSAILCALKSK